MYGLADGGLFGLLALGQLLVERTAHDARRHSLRVAQLPGLMDRLAGQAEVRDGRDVPGWNIPFALAAMALDFAPLLRGVVLPAGAWPRPRFPRRPPSPAGLLL